MEAPATQSGFRRAVLKKFAVGILCFLLIAGFYGNIAFAGCMFLLTLGGVGFVNIVLGILELLTGKSYQKLEDAWMALAGGERGVAGTLIVLGAAIVIMVIIVVLAVLFI